MEESHEYDRRKFHDRKAALPPAPKGGTVGRGPQQGAGGPDAGFHNEAYGGRNGVNGGRYGQQPNGGRYPPPQNGACPGERVPAWGRGPHGLPPRPPPPVDSYNGGEPYLDGAAPYRERDRDRHRDRDRDRPPPRSRPAPEGRPGEVDTYIPAYQRERVDRFVEDRRRRDRTDLDPRDPRSRTRSRSPATTRAPDREREHYTGRR